MAAVSHAIGEALERATRPDPTYEATPVEARNYLVAHVSEVELRSGRRRAVNAKRHMNSAFGERAR
jgi:hypothetical protein